MCVCVGVRKCMGGDKEQTVTSFGPKFTYGECVCVGGGGVAVVACAAEVAFPLCVVFLLDV